MKSTEHGRTRHFNIMLVLLAVAGLMAALIAVDPSALARGAQHGWVRPHAPHGAGMAFCAGRQGHVLERMGPYLRAWLDLNAAQEESWARVERTLAVGLASLRDACSDLAADDENVAMPERLAAMESAMAAGTDAVRAIRPAFTAFYGTLDEDQQRKIDVLWSRSPLDVR